MLLKFGMTAKDVYEMRSLISKRRFYLKRLKPEPVEPT